MRDTEEAKFRDRLTEMLRCRAFLDPPDSVCVWKNVSDANGVDLTSTFDGVCWHWDAKDEADEKFFWFFLKSPLRLKSSGFFSFFSVGLRWKSKRANRDCASAARAHPPPKPCSFIFLEI